MIRVLTIVAILGLMVLVSCRANVVSYETIQSFSPAQGSPMMGYSAAALDEATRLSEVRQKCGTPLAEWEDRIPFFEPTLRHLKYDAYDVHGNVLATTFTFVMTSSDPSLIAIDYGESAGR